MRLAEKMFLHLFPQFALHFRVVANKIEELGE